MQTAKFSSEDEVGGTDVVNDAIEEAEAEVSDDFGDPSRKSTFVLDSTDTRYEFRVNNKKTYRIDRVIIRKDDNSRRVYTEGESASESLQKYTKDFEFNTITFASDTVSAWDGNRVEVDYIPIQIHHLTRLKAALSLIDTSAVINAEENMPAIAIRFMSRIKRLEKAMSSPTAVGSEDEKYYNPTYGEIIPQRRFKTY